MKSNEEVYCILCGQIKPRSMAQVVFQTGFYMTKYPLANCTECLQNTETHRDIASDKIEAIYSGIYYQPKSVRYVEVQ